MKLSKETIAIFNNFAHINTNLLLKEGAKVSTITSQKHVMASTSVAETFPVQFGIYDLNEFLGAMSLFDDPELEFSEKFVTIKEGDASIKYFAAAVDVLTAPTKDITFPAVDVQFTLTASMLNTIKKTAGVLRSSDLAIIGDGEKIVLQVGDKKNATGNVYSTQAGTTDKTFRANLKVDNLKMLPADYVVSISSKKISRFQATAGDLVYYVAVEADSTFEA